MNGLPLAVFELKNPYDEHPTVDGALNQIGHYRHDIPQIFEFNAVTAVSDGVATLHGMWTSTSEWFAPWKSIDGVTVEASTTGSMKTLVEGLFRKDRLLAYIRDFIVFEVVSDKVTKKGAKYHQFFAVRIAAQKAIESLRSDTSRRIGVIWHTTGSGKSLSMVFLVGILRHQPGLNPTFVIEVDRTDLDDQLHDHFVAARSLVGDVKHAETVEQLREMLRSEGGEVIFTTIEKFRLVKNGEGAGELSHPVLSTRSNILVIADEAHRTQYGFLKGYARYLAEAVPNARRIGFTGTPISFSGADTVEVFGDVIHTYDIRQAQEDRATVPIYYVPRQIRLHLGRGDMDAALREIAGGYQVSDLERKKSRWAALAAAAGARERVEQLARDLLNHFHERTATLLGKALVVCMTRANCVRLYEALTALPGAPDVKVVMTGDLTSDPPEWSRAGHITTKTQRDAIKQRLDPPQRRQRTLDAVKRLLLRESQVQPLLLVFEDLHWVDSETQAMLEGLVDSLPTARILLLVNYRPEYQHAWSSKSYYRQLPLDPLPPESAQAVLDALLGNDSDLRRLKELLIDRTEGNPFFLEESVRTLVETKALTGERGGYRLARSVESVQVPATVQAVLAARIDRLPPTEKRLLQSAAVIGHEVPLVLLGAIAEESEEQLRRDLAHLQAAEFLYETRMFPDLEYTFRHALTHEVAYGELLQNRRRALHARIVEAIERLYFDRIVEHLERLAHHALRGEVWDKAVRYLRESGAKAVARSANREAIQFFNQALQALGNLPETPQALSEALDIRIVLGPALISVKGTPAPEVEASYRHAHDLCNRLSDTSRLFPVLWGLWFSTFGQGRYAGARELAERLRAVAESGQDSGQLVEAHHSMWATLHAMGETASTLVYLERGLTLYDREQHGSQAFFYGGHDPGTCCRYHLAMARWLLGYPDQALEASRSALSLAAELSHAGTTVLTLLYAGVLHYHRGEFRVAAEHAEVMLRLATEKGFLGYVGDTAVLLARALMDEGGVERLQSVHETFAATRSGRARWRDTLAACLLADAHGRAGQPETGLEVLGSLSEEQRRSFYAPELHRVEGELLLRRGMPRSHAEAEHCFRRAIEIADRRGERSLQLRAALSLARLLESAGRRAEARPVLVEAYGYFTEGFGTADLRTAKNLLDSLS